jgi:hypothetical protein
MSRVGDAERPDRFQSNLYEHASRTAVSMRSIGNFPHSFSFRAVFACFFFYGGQVPFVCYLFNFVFLVFSNSYFTENQHKNLIFFCCMGALILNFVLSSMLEYHAREIVAADNTDV